MKNYYAIQLAEEKREADIYIFGTIVDEDFWETEVSPTKILEEIKALDVDVLNVHINSYGGMVSEGWAIYNVLREHKAKVNTFGDGFVASAALYPFMAGDNRYASNLSAYYLHPVSKAAYGYAAELRAAADEVEFLTDVGIQAFVDRAGMDPEEVRALTEQETWLTPAQALEYGIATAITQDQTARYAQDAKQDIFQRFFQPAQIAPKEEKTLPEQPEKNKILQLFERSKTK